MHNLHTYFCSMKIEDIIEFIFYNTPIVFVKIFVQNIQITFLLIFDSYYF